MTASAQLSVGPEPTSSERVASPELQILLCCARARFGSDETERLHELLDRGIDWARLTRLAHIHKMIPLLYTHLSEVADPHSHPWMAVLRQHYLGNAGHTLHLTRELLAILHMFESEGIPAVPYKGPVLAVRLYGNVALRQVSDLDILVRKSDVLSARAALAAGGYLPVYDLAGETRKFKLAHGYCEDFQGPTGTPLELHWAFTNGDVHFPVTVEELLPRLQEVQIGGSPVRSFAWEDLLPILCVHGAKHRWERLEWICGVAEILRTPDAIDWETVLARASRTGTVRTMLVGIALARELIGAECPPGPLAEQLRRKEVVALAAELQDRILLEHADEPEGWRAALRRDLFMLRLRDNAGDRLRYLWHRGARRVARVQHHEVPVPIRVPA